MLYIYQRYLNDPDKAPMDPVLAEFGPLTASQRRIGKYFLVVAVVLLLQILVGSIMAHAYDRPSFYGIEIDRFLPFNFLRDVHIQSPVVWIALSWIGAALFLGPAISGGEPKGQAFVDVLLLGDAAIVVGARRQLSRHHGVYRRRFWFGNQGLSTSSLAARGRSGFSPGWRSGASSSSARAVADPLWRPPGDPQFWSGRIRLEHLIWASTVNIALLYVCGMVPLTGIEKSFTITDFWRCGWSTSGSNSRSSSSPQRSAPIC